MSYIKDKESASMHTALLADTSALANYATPIMAQLDMIPEITLHRSISGEIYKKSRSEDPADQDVARRAMATLACLHALPHFTVRLDHTRHFILTPMMISWSELNATGADSYC